jgi:hypothetical protein
LLLLLWFFTPHSVAAANHNLLQFPPWALALGATLFGRRSPSPRRLRTARALAGSCLIASAVGALLSVTTLSDQDNAGFVLLMLPLWLGISLALRAVAAGVKKT